MLRVYLLFSVCFLTLFVNAQNCTNCKKEYHDYTGDIHVKNNEDVCVTGTFSGNIEFSGGKLTICGNAQVGTLNYKQPALLTISESARVKIQNINSNKEVSIINYCDSFIIQNGNFNQPFNLVNNGKCYLQGGAFNSTLNFSNNDTLIFNTSLVISRNCSFVNTKYFAINGNFTANSGTLNFWNACQFYINGDMILNGQTLQVDRGFLKVNNANINSGSIVLNNESVFYVNNINVGGVIEGKGSRSTMVCTQNPNLNRQPSIKGQLSLCVKTGNFNPNPGTVESPATVDCNNPIGGSECNPQPFGYAYFRMLPVTSSDWNNSATWEMWNGVSWNPAPSGKYPSQGSAVLIGDGKTMTLTQDVRVSKLVLGENGNGKIICSPGTSVSLTIDDTAAFNQQSSIELNQSRLTLKGQLLTDIKCKGSATAGLELNLPGVQKNLVMDQSEPGESNALRLLTMNNPSGTITLADTLIIIRLVDPTAGTMQTSGKLVLQSDKNYTASIGEGEGNYIVGKVKVQRYIPEIARRFRFVSPTVKGATLLDWQDDVYVTGNNAAGTATGQQVGTLNSAGFDATQSFEPSMYFYNETKPGNQNNGWVAATNETNTLADYPLPVGKGYRLFIRGDRSDTNRLNGQNNTQNEVTLDMYGELVTGDVTVPITYTSTGVNSEDGWNLIGNPYASAYDWKAFYKDHSLNNQFEPTVWVYDSRTNAYVSYNVLAEAGSFTNGIIPSGQSFWVKAIAPIGSITLKEKYKVVSVENDEIRNFVEWSSHKDELSVKLIKDSVNEDEMIIKHINGLRTGMDSFDISKFWSDAVGIAQYNSEDQSYLDLSCRPINFKEADYIPIYYFVNANGNYTLKMKLSVATIYKGSKAYLFDSEVGRYIDIATEPIYNFTVNLPNPSAGQSNRFFIVYFPATPPPTALNYLFAEKQDTAGVHLSWGSLSEVLPTTYYVQRGYSSTNFTTIAVVDGVGGFDKPSDYELLDTAADLRRDLYYRIGTQDSLNTQITYSPITYLPVLNTGLTNEFPSLKDKLNIYPIPAQHTLTIEYRNAVFNEAIAVTVFDIAGKEVLATQFNEPKLGSNALQLDISELNNGLYFMNITGESGESIKVKVVKN